MDIGRRLAAIRNKRDPPERSNLLRERNHHEKTRRDFASYKPFEGPVEVVEGLFDVPKELLPYHELDTDQVKQFWLDPKRWNLETTFKIYYFAHRKIVVEACFKSDNLSGD